MYQNYPVPVLERDRIGTDHINILLTRPAPLRLRVEHGDKVVLTHPLIIVYAKSVIYYPLIIYLFHNLHYTLGNHHLSHLLPD